MERCTASIFYLVIVFESGNRGSDPYRRPAGVNNACEGLFVMAYSFSTVVSHFLSFFDIYSIERAQRAFIYVAAYSFPFSHVFPSRMEHLLTFVPAGFIALKPTSFWDGYSQMGSGSSSCSLNMQLKLCHTRRQPDAKNKQKPSRAHPDRPGSTWRGEPWSDESTRRVIRRVCRLRL